MFETLLLLGLLAAGFSHLLPPVPRPPHGSVRRKGGAKEESSLEGSKPTPRSSTQNTSLPQRKRHPHGVPLKRIRSSMLGRTVYLG